MSSCEQTSTAESESRLVRILPLWRLQPSPTNDELYRPIDLDDPEFQGLAASIKQLGIQEPIKVTRDHYIISGHRRHAAARVAGLQEVPCIVEEINHGSPEFFRLLRECNRQRFKTFDEIVRERILDATVDPTQVYQKVIQSHYKRLAISSPVDTITIEGEKRRAEISPAKRPMLEAIKRVIYSQRKYWPLSDRSIHYDLLNNPPLRHASKPGSTYQNDRQSYQDLCDLLTRARLDGFISFDAIADPTRTVAVWDAHPNIGPFVTQQLEDFLTNYWRDKQQSQPNHIEIVGEKNTIESSIRNVAFQYCIPYTIGRGYCSIDPRHQIAQRFESSGKKRLVILVMSDFDPEGEDIAHSFARSMRDDFGIDDMEAKKVCLTHDQAQEYKLPQTFDMKTSSSRYKEHVRKYGKRAHELESLPPALRSRLLCEAIEDAMDLEAYEAEEKALREDLTKLEALRQAVLPELQKAMRPRPPGERGPEETT